MRPNIHQLSSLIRRHAERCDDERSDADLLALFSETRDEAAFEQILRRYGSMVYAICRRALRTTADAEDAYQATFLTLVRRCRTVRHGGALGGWLHATAIHSAAEIVRRNRRREARELALAREEATETKATGDAELARILDEELAGLPDRYRDPIVLCRVRGVTLSAAAEDLGLSVAGVWKRVQRGENLLRDRLLRRGVAAPVAGLAAVLMAAPNLPAAEAISADFLRAALARESVRAAPLPVAWWCVGGVAALGAVVAVLASSRAVPAVAPQVAIPLRALPAPLPAPLPASLPGGVPAKAEPGKGWTVIRGVVTDSDGRALPKAKLGLRAHGDDIVLTERSDANGIYSFVVPNLFWNEADTVSLTVIEPASPRVRVPILPPFEETRRMIPVRLMPVGPAVVQPARQVFIVAGQVTASDTGKPVANALVEIASDIVPGASVSMRTGDNGRYSLEAADPSMCSVRVVPPSGTRLLPVVKPLRGKGGNEFVGTDIALATGTVLKGIVLDATNGQPVAGARVQHHGNGMWKPHGPMASLASTDAEGRYEIVVPRRSGTLAVTASDVYRLLVRDATVANPIPHEATELLRIEEKGEPELPTIRLTRGGVIHGTVRLPDGSPLAAGTVWCAERFGTMEPRSHRPIPVVDGKFAIRGCDSRRSYSIVVTDRESRHAAAATLKVTDRDNQLTLSVVESRTE